MPRRRPRLMPTTASRRNAGARALAFSFIGARARTYMSFSFKSEGISEVADGVIALRVEPGDARDGLDAARKSAPGDEDDHVDRLGDQTARHRDDAFLDQLFEPVERRARAVRMDGSDAAREIGRAHVWTPDTNVHLVWRLCLEKQI